MPLMMTDVAEGQKAGLQLDLQPLLAQAEKERIPLEIEKMQQSLQASKLSQQKDMLQIQALVESQKDDIGAKTLIGDLSKDPTFKDLPIPDQMFKIGQILDANGKFKQGAEFYSLGQRAKLQEAQTTKANFDVQQLKLDKAHSYMLMLNEDGSNINQVMMAAQSEGALSKEDVAILSAKAQEAAQSGTFKNFKNFAIKNIDSIKGRAEAAKETKDREDVRLREARLTLEARKLEATNNRFIAALTSKNDKAVEDMALKQYTDASIKVPRLVEDLRKAKRDLAALPAVPKPGMFFDSEDSSKDQRAILQETATAIQAELDAAKAARDTYAQFLPTATKSKIDQQNPEPKAPPENQAGKLKPITSAGSGTKEAPFSLPSTQKDMVSGKYYNTPRGTAKWDGTKFVKE